jgi:hypothetical protein
MVSSAKISPTFAEILDNFDGDETIRTYADLLTAPARIFRDKNEVAQIRAQRAQAAKQQQDAAEQGMAARAAVEGAKTMSDTDVGGGMNLLSSLIGG